MRIVSKFVAAGLSCLPWGKLVATPAQELSGGTTAPTKSLARILTGRRPSDHRRSVSGGSRQDCPEVRLIRTYGTEKRVLGLGPFVAQDYPHLNVYLGIYKSSKYRSATEEQIAKAIELANKYPNIVEYVIVGNECLDQDFADGAVSVEQLIADINKVKQSVPANVKVTTCLGFHSALNPQKMEDGSPNPYSGRARIMESGSCGSQKPIA